MRTFQLHIGGVVQGVGFRPAVYRWAMANHLYGWVLNGSKGVVIRINANNIQKARKLVDGFLANPPKQALITEVSFQEVPNEKFEGFGIIASEDPQAADLPLTPDFAMCEDCRRELEEVSDRRYQYAFITCTNCGPRYSITRKLPYDRPLTTMDHFHMCDTCEQEYDDPLDRRYFSQTNSCPECGIQLSGYEPGSGNYLKNSSNEDLINQAVEMLKAGHIAAVKGIGGYLLLCDATNQSVVEQLRKRKYRPAKPFAVLYPDIVQVKKHYQLRKIEEEALKSTVAPIVLLRRKVRAKGVCESVAPGLSRVGVMLPYAPLLYLISQAFGKPLVATSANISGSPIIYRDEDAVKHLASIADLILMNDREILIPQDDSVMLFTEQHQQRVILRRSRGLAPNYFQSPKYFEHLNNVMATGAEMKGAFALVKNNRCYVSQYLGSMESYESQESFERVYDHLSDVIGFQPKKLLADTHPGYFGHQWVENQIRTSSVQNYYFQHHEAHFAAVLGENELMGSEVPVLGFIWDGTGLGTDGQVWGSETFLYQNEKIEHLQNIGYAPVIAGDKMSREPRLSLLAFASFNAQLEQKARQYFNDREWNIYQKLKNTSKLQTSSLGRLFDAVACLLTGITHSTFEGEAAMYLEELARKARPSKQNWIFDSEKPFALQVMDRITNALNLKTSKAQIARQFHLLLVGWVQYQAEFYQARKLAFSGGVFQNSLLVDMLIDQLGDSFELYFHQELSPNDENIAYGQLMRYSIDQQEQPLQKLITQSILAQ